MSSRAAAVPPVPAARSMIYLGMYVHKDSITIAVLPALAKAPTRLEKLANDLPKLTKWMERVARDAATVPRIQNAARPTMRARAPPTLSSHRDDSRNGSGTAHCTPGWQSRMRARS